MWLSFHVLHHFSQIPIRFTILLWQRNSLAICNSARHMNIIQPRHTFFEIFEKQRKRNMYKMYDETSTPWWISDWHMFYKNIFFIFFEFWINICLGNWTYRLFFVFDISNWYHTTSKKVKRKTIWICPLSIFIVDLNLKI